jgi:hypothetical protein
MKVCYSKGNCKSTTSRPSIRVDHVSPAFDRRCRCQAAGSDEFAASEKPLLWLLPKDRY